MPSVALPCTPVDVDNITSVPEEPRFWTEQFIARKRAKFSESAGMAISPRTVHDSIPRLPERYQPVGLIAHGGMGAVWRVVDRQFGRELAVKVMVSASASDSGAVARFEREAELTGVLQHPGIPPVVDRGVLADGSPFFSMKLVEGQTLARILHQHRNEGMSNADASRLLTVFEHVCQAVGFAHSVGVIHRDLKPSNIMVGAFGEVQVMDWGMAKRLSDEDPPERDSSTTATSVDDSDRDVDCAHVETVTMPPSTNEVGADETPNLSSEAKASLTRVGAIMGTPAYLPPEQARGRSHLAGRRADVFGLGAILCEILTGQPPYHADSDVPVFHKAIRADLREAHICLDECPADDALTSLARRCLSVDESNRPADATVLAREVRGYLDAVQQRLRETEIKQAAAEATAIAERKRRRIAWALAATFVLALTGFAAMGIMQIQQRSEAFAYVEHIESALQSASARRQGYHEVLKDTDNWQWRDWVSNPAQWEAEIHAAEADLNQAVAMAEKTGDYVTEDLFRRIEAFQSGLNSDKEEMAFILLLDQLRLQSAALYDGQRSHFPVSEEYLAAFQEFGIDLEEGSEREVADQLSRLPIREPLLASLDDWMLAALHPQQIGGNQLSSSDIVLLGRVQHIAEFMEADFWRLRLRDADLWKNKQAFRAVCEETPSESISPPLWVLTSLFRAEDGVTYDVDWLLRGQELFPADYWINLATGNALSLTQDNRAAQFYRAALVSRPKDVIAYNNLGGALAGQGDYEGARTVLLRASTLAPGSEMLLNNLGAVEFELQNLDEAEHWYRQALSTNPESAETIYNLGTLLAERGDSYGAIDLFRQALDWDPQHADAHRDLAIALTEVGERDEAERHHQLALEIQPEDAVHHYNFGVSLLEHFQLDRAEIEFQRAIELDPQYVAAYCNLGSILHSRGDYNGAIQLFQTALENDTNSVEAHTNLGAAWLEQREFSRAVVEFRLALAIDDQIEQTWYNLALAHTFLNDHQAAVQAYETALTLNPEFPEALCRLGKIYLDAGEYDRALDLLQRGHSAASTLPHWNQPSGEWLRECKTLARPVVAGEAITTIRDILSETDASDDFPLTEGSYRRIHLVRFQSGKHYQIKMEAEFDTFLRVQGPDGQLLTCNDDTCPPENLNSSVVISVFEDGVYRIIATGIASNAVGPYTIELQEVVPVGEPVMIEGTLDADDEFIQGKALDRHTIELEAGQIHLFELRSTDFDTVLTLVNPEFSQIVVQNNDASPGTTELSRIDFIPRVKGAYNIVVTSYDAGSSGDYQLRVQRFDSMQTE